MDDALRVIVEMNQSIWSTFKNSLEGLSSDEIHWRPLPQGNNLNIIIRHLRIEAQWHLDGLESGKPMPTIAVPARREIIDEVSSDFEENLKEFEGLYARFIETLRTATLPGLEQRTSDAYCEASSLKYRLAYHQGLHLAMHCGQIRTIRNLYRTTRGLPARFHPDNPTFHN